MRLVGGDIQRNTITEFIGTALFLLVLTLVGASMLAFAVAFWCSPVVNVRYLHPLAVLSVMAVSVAASNLRRGTPNGQSPSSNRHDRERGSFG